MSNNLNNVIVAMLERYKGKVWDKEILAKYYLISITK